MTIEEKVASLGEDVTDHRLSRPDGRVVAWTESGVLAGDLSCASRARRAADSRSALGPDPMDRARPAGDHDRTSRLSAPRRAWRVAHSWSIPTTSRRSWTPRDRSPARLRRQRREPAHPRPCIATPRPGQRRDHRRRRRAAGAGRGRPDDRPQRARVSAVPRRSVRRDLADDRRSARPDPGGSRGGPARSRSPRRTTSIARSSKTRDGSRVSSWALVRGPAVQGRAAGTTRAWPSTGRGTSIQRTSRPMSPGGIAMATATRRCRRRDGSSMRCRTRDFRSGATPVI